MADDKTNTGVQDKLRVDLNDPSEVEYLHQQFPGKTHQQIVEAVREFGPLREDVIRQLRGKASL